VRDGLADQSGPIVPRKDGWLKQAFAPAIYLDSR
jgi:hypothetical protein